MKKRITGNRSRAKNTGLLYLVGIIALAVVACIPLLSHELAPVGVLEFWKVFTAANLKDYKTADTLIKLICASLYVLMLLGVVINVFRSFGRLRWLFKKKGMKTYGFNRNVYAMDDLGRIYSGSYAVILITYFLIAILCGVSKISEFGTLSLILLGAGALIRLIAGFTSAKTGYYDLQSGIVVEKKRVLGRFSPLFRNFLQLVAVFAIMFFFLKATTLNTLVPTLLKKGGMNELFGDMATLISLALQLFIVLCMFVLITHATAITEYNFNGVRGPGMKNFRVFSFFVFLAGGAAVAYKYFFVDGKVFDKFMLVVAAIALGSFIIEILMRNRPKHPDEKEEKVIDTDPDNEEVAFDTLTKQYEDEYSKPHESDKPKKKVKEKKAKKQKIKSKYQHKVYVPLAAGAAAGVVAADNGVAPCPQAAACAQTPACTQNAAAGYPQPCIVPQLYPIPQPYPVAQSQPAATPAVNILPIMPFSTDAMRPAAEPAKEEKDDNVETIEHAEKVENGKAEVDCPSCGARLRVNGSVNYHRCPACDKVFELRKVKK